MRVVSISILVHRNNLELRIKEIVKVKFTIKIKNNMELLNYNNVIYRVVDNEWGYKLYQGTKENCIEYIKENNLTGKYK
jgi:hypothetical protein